MRARQLVIVVSVLLLLPLGVRSAHAQCAFNRPGKAKGLKLSFVRAHPSCPSYDVPAPNTSTTSDTPACTPVEPTTEFQCSPSFGCVRIVTDYTFGPKGSCSLSMKPGIAHACAGSGTADCMDMLIKAQCTDIRDGDGAPISYEPGWELILIARATYDDPAYGDITTIDLAIRVPFLPSDGKGDLKLKASLADVLFGYGFRLPVCTNLEILVSAIDDPMSNLFARAGTSTR